MVESEQAQSDASVALALVVCRAHQDARQVTLKARMTNRRVPLDELKGCAEALRDQGGLRAGGKRGANREPWDR